MCYDLEEHKVQQRIAHMSKHVALQCECNNRRVGRVAAHSQHQSQACERASFGDSSYHMLLDTLLYMCIHIQMLYFLEQFGVHSTTEQKVHRVPIYPLPRQMHRLPN